MKTIFQFISVKFAFKILFFVRIFFFFKTCIFSFLFIPFLTNMKASHLFLSQINCICKYSILSKFTSSYTPEFLRPTSTCNRRDGAKLLVCFALLTRILVIALKLFKRLIDSLVFHDLTMKQ